MASESSRIVIINDDLNDVSLLRRCLVHESNKQYQFIISRTGEQGIDDCIGPDSRRPDCVIVDLHLPDMSGLDVLKKLQDDTGEVRLPVVLFIDSGEECKAATAALRAGAQDYIAKSWLTADGLACAVENAIERFRLKERLRAKRADLEKQDREIRAIIQNVPDIITRFDRQYRHVYINPAIERATGIPPERFLGKTSREAGMPEALCDFWESVLSEAMVSKRELSFEFNLDGPSGPRCYQARLVPQFSPSGDVESVLAVSTDVTEGKRAEETFRASEEHLRNVIDRLIAFVGVMTPAGIMVEANKPALEIASLEPKDVLGKPLEETYWWSYSPKVQADLRRAIECAARGEVVRYDVPIRIDENRFLTIDFMIAPLIDASGKVTHLIPSGVDITERKRTEREIRKIAARERVRSVELKTVLRATPAAIMIADDPQCRRITGNTALYKLLGIPEKSNVSATADDIDATQRAFQEFRNGAPIPPDELPLQLATSQGIETEGTELTLRFKDGTERHIYGNATPLRDPDGAIYGAISAFIDITKLKEAEQALRLNARRFRRFASSDIIGIVFGDLYGQLSDVNDEYLRIIGYTREQFQANPVPWAEITPPDWRAADEQGIAEAKSKGSCQPYEKEFIRRDGSRIPILIGYTLLDEAGEDLVAFVLDLTERKRWERAIKDSERRKDEFMSMLAHELRNPLAAILTSVHILTLKGSDDPGIKWSRDVIERQVRHLMRLIEDLLDISRISVGKIQLSPAPVDFRDVVARAAESVWSLISSKQHDLKIDLPERPLALIGDSVRLEQVLGNLLTNAAKYTDNGGSIKLTARREGASIVLRLRDNGIGIAPDMLPHIFDLYTQVDSNLTRSQGGLGIGLTLVKMLVEMHGGSVSAASDGPGQGSEFTIRLPASDQPSEPSIDHAEDGLVPPESSSNRTRPRVLVVDDNEDMARGLVMLIESAGYEVEMAHDGPAALDIARAFQPEIVILDIALPGMTGYELAQSFQNEEKFHTATFIGMSGYGQTAGNEQALSATFDHYMSKPVDLDNLLPILAQTRARVRTG